MGKCIGIDLGTGFSAVAVVEGGQPKIIVNSEGGRTTPSVVAFDKNGERKVGNTAKRQAIVNPTNTVSFVKRLIGNKYEAIKEYADKLPYKVENGYAGMACVVINEKKYTPQEISAAVLQKMKVTAEEYLGESVTDAVITVPAYFDDDQRKATQDAGEIAGLNVRRIINEPTAAAIAFGCDKLDKDMRILVCDIGCGTTDLSVLELGGGVFEVIATNGDSALGGSDIDNLIMDWLTEEGKRSFSTDLSKDPIALQRLKDAAEKAKIELSSATSTDINLPYITAIDNVPQHLNCTLTRAQLEKMMVPFIGKCRELCKGVLTKADLNVTDIDEILLVGGSTRIPAIQDMIKSYFGKEGNKSVNPDEAVALGAAIQGAVLSGEKSDLVLLDVTPLNFNITTMGSVATPMIEANTTIPTEKSEIFSTAVDNQPSVDIEITQGNRGMAKDNKSIGHFILDGILPARRGVPQIEVTFSIDANGVLTVTAVDKGTGKSQNIRIEGSSGLSKDEIERMKAEAEAHADEDRKCAERISKLNMAEQSIYQTERNIEEYSDKLSEGQKSKLTDALNNLKSVYEVKDEDRDLTAIEEASKNLMLLWYSVSAELNKDSSTGATAENPFANMGNSPFTDMFTGMGGQEK